MNMDNSRFLNEPDMTDRLIVWVNENLKGVSLSQVQGEP